MKLNPRQQFYYGRELYLHHRYQEALQIFENFLDSRKGWIENKIEACCQCTYCHENLGHSDKALEALLRSFTYDSPRAEICCELGRLFLARGKARLAIYWYSLALSCTRDDSRGGFVSLDCYGYLPCIQMCVCYILLGDLERAEQFNELAASFKPDSPVVQHNREYFRGMKEQ